MMAFSAPLACAMAWALFAGSALAATSPRQFWAEKDGMVHIQPLTHGISVHELVDRMAIQESFARWGLAYDQGRFDVVKTLFTEDATYLAITGAYRPGASAKGKDAIAARVAESTKGQADQRRHLISNVVIEDLTVTTAKALAYGVVTVAADGLTIGATVIYTAELRKEADGAWRFSRFVIGMDDYIRHAGDNLERGEARPAK